jgi:thiamine biosynthesis lipoprotein
VLLDLGATGKALAVDRAATRASIAVDGPVLVAVGGDLRAVAGVGEAPWLIEVAETPDDPGQAWVHVADGGIATSSTTSRRWRQGWHWSHHVLDPATGQSATEHWRTATVAAQTCVDANAASTGALVKGAEGATWLEEQQLPSRLVHRGGAVRLIAGWPVEEAA